MSDSTKKPVSRRSLLTGGAAIAAAAVLPKVPARAQSPARWRRYNVASSQGQAMLGYYRTAITRMLQLPPSDPRNWYRLAFTHYLDCPHGNWWLFPWHRGFTGWAEQIVRRFSGFDGFAFPYWDWTANPQVPPALQSMLPSGAPFLPNIAAFQSAFQQPLANSGYWQGAQLTQLQARGITSNAVLWDQLANPANPNWPSFFPASGGGQSFPNVRNPSPNLDCRTSQAVSAPILASAMAAQDYATFSSPPAPQHSDMVGFALLEGQPHNNVHNNTGGIVYQQQGGQCGPNYTNTGGFMQAFLSPTDPLFWLHHSNIDRLWDAWTRQQIAAGRTNYIPQGSDYTRWAQEPFLFFVDANGSPVSQNQAGYYATIGQFNYDYQPGSVGGAALLRATRGNRPVRRVVGEPPRSPSGAMLGGARAGTIAVRLQPTLLQAAAPGGGQRMLAKVTIVPPMLARGQAVRILVDTGDQGEAIEAGSISLFGPMMPHGPLVVTIALDPAMTTLRGRKRLRSGGYLYFRAATAPPAGAKGPLGAVGEQSVPVDAVVVEAH